MFLAILGFPCNCVAVTLLLASGTEDIDSEGAVVMEEENDTFADTGAVDDS